MMDVLNRRGESLQNINIYQITMIYTSIYYNFICKLYSNRLNENSNIRGMWGKNSWVSVFAKSNLFLAYFIQRYSF